MHPYMFQIRSFAKRRWVGRQFLDTLAEEFGSCTREYFVRRAPACWPCDGGCNSCLAWQQAAGVREGFVNVNDARTDPEHIIQDGECIVTNVREWCWLTWNVVPFAPDFLYCRNTYTSHL